MAPTKLFLVRSEAKAAELRPYFSNEWLIKGYRSALIGRRFDVIMIADQDERFYSAVEWAQYIQRLRIHLNVNGTLIEVY